MPHTTATITGTQREAIYEFLVEQLSRLSDIPLAIKHEDFATAGRLAREVSQDFRLLNDLGWGNADTRPEITLSMPPRELAETLRRLQLDADGALSGSPSERDTREAEEACRQRDQLVLDTASDLLAELNAKGRESA